MEKKNKKTQLNTKAVKPSLAGQKDESCILPSELLRGYITSENMQ